MFAVGALGLVVGLVGWSYADGGIVRVLLDSALTADQKVSALRAFFDRFGAAAPIGYVAMVVLEVVIAPPWSEASGQVSLGQTSLLPVFAARRKPTARVARRQRAPA